MTSEIGSGASLLDQVKQLPVGDLTRIVKNLRDKIIDTVSETGGHLAPSLGVVELTVALHRVFDSPQDRIVWDVGHQAYAHKLLTGRWDNFGTLRQFGGISGFPKPDESPHDTFVAGHASTSVSAATGIAKGRDLKGEEFSVIAVIGDGALTGGMSFEALNFAGHSQTDIIVVLNDNSMSIAPNVGGLATYLSRIRTNPSYFKLKSDLHSIVRKFPLVGDPVARSLERVKDSLKYLVVTGMFFEELGFTYLGPVDGHNLHHLDHVLRDARSISGPVFVHVVTTKGKGYGPAEKTPDRFHGIGAFDVESGQPLKKKGMTFSAVFGETLSRLAQSDQRVVGITAAMPGGTGVGVMADVDPARFIDVGIAEEHGVTLSAGLAREGLRPVFSVYSTFLQRGYDQVIHDVCLQSLPVVFAIDRGGIVGEDGPTHHGVFDLSYLRHIPNMVLMAPRDENQLQHMLKTAIARQDGPTAVRYPRGNVVGVEMDSSPKVLPIGKGELLRRGSDITIAAIGSMVHPALTAAKVLSEQGISAEVLDAQFVKPLDETLLLSSASRTRALVTVEENALAGGFGSAVIEMLTDRGYGAIPVHRIGIPDEFVPHGSQATLRKEYGLDEAGIAETVRGFFKSLQAGKRTSVQVLPSD